MHNRLLEFAQRFEILYYYKFGFRKKHSTEWALIHLVDKIASSIDQNKVITGVFLVCLKPLIPSIIKYFFINWNDMAFEE